MEVRYKVRLNSKGKIYVGKNRKASPRKETVIFFSPSIRYNCVETKNACEFVKKVMNPNQGVFLKNFLQCFSLLSKFSNSFTVRFQFLCFMKYIFSNLHSITYYQIYWVWLGWH